MVEARTVFCFGCLPFFCYYLSLSWLELRLWYMHRSGALLTVHTFGVWSLQTCNGVVIAEVKSCGPHGFLGLWRKKKYYSATLINLYVCVFVYSNMSFTHIVIVCALQSPYPVNMEFKLPSFFGRLVADFEYCCVAWNIQVGAEWNSFDWHILYFLKYLHLVTWVQKSLQKPGFKLWQWRMSPVVTSVKWVYLGGCPCS